MHDPLPSEVRRPDWRDTRVACGSLVALRRRLSPGLPLSRSLSKRAAPSELRCVDCYANEKAANISMTSRVAGGPADLATCVALVPWLCVTVFRRLCSEQRAWHFTTNGSFCSPFATQHCSNVGKRAQECNVAVQKVQELARRAGKGAAFWCKRPVSHLNRKGAWGQNGGPRLSFTSAMRRADPARRHPHF